MKIKTIILPYVKRRCVFDMYEPFYDTIRINQYNTVDTFEIEITDNMESITLPHNFKVTNLDEVIDKCNITYKNIVL